MESAFRRIGVVFALLLGTQTSHADSGGFDVFVTNQGAGLSVFNLRKPEKLRSVDLGNGDPRGLAVTPDGKLLLIANQKSGDLAVVDTATLAVVRRIPIGKNPEFLRVHPNGTKAFVTYEPGSKGGPPTKEGTAGKDDDDETPGQVAVVDLKKWKVIISIVGAPETEGIEFTPDGKRFAITNEGDDSVTVYDIASGKKLQTVDLSGQGHRPRGIKRAPDGNRYLVTMENSNNLLVLDANFKIIKSVPTAFGPYGVGFDRAAKRVFVAASRADRLQVFDGTSYEKIAEIPVGKRCWHFTLTPDESQMLLACGRSNDIEVIDLKEYRVTSTIPGFSMPWGIVTYPQANGSLDAAH